MKTCLKWNCLLVALLFTVSGCEENTTKADSKSNDTTPARDKVMKTEKTETDEAKSQHKKKRKPNRLAKESSPYLLLHAYNPVDWYPWGSEALAKAKKEGKPIFLSIGYSSCYWCHVMERKVFENEKIAKYMNEHFVNIKVDREERPDIDDIYMNSLNVFFELIGSNQGGGWPLSMFLTSDGKPLMGGTYFPPKDEGGRPGFQTIMEFIVKNWNDKKVRPKFIQQADVIVENVKARMKPVAAVNPPAIERELVDTTVKAVINSFDPKYGGIDFQPNRPNGQKFPTAPKLALLQYQIERNHDAESQKVLYFTLDRIAAGGIHDQLGGGFHRYSTDRFWQVPHFEKMLYNQSQLASIYMKAWQKTKKKSYRQAAEDIFEFVEREMTDKKGGFHSALDAETDGIEGKYYVWSHKEVESILGKSDAEIFETVYGMKEENPFKYGFVLHLPVPIAEAAKTLDIDEKSLSSRLKTMKKKLLTVRQKRSPLLKDDKILTSWNAMMVRAYAEAGGIFKDEKYIATAEKAARFLLLDLRDKHGRLYRTWRNGHAKLKAYLDDYAFLVEALLTLHQVTGKQEWLDAALKLNDLQIKYYWSKEAGAFFFTAHDHEELIARTRNSYDSVLPSGNSVAVRNLVRLAKLTGDKKYLEYAKGTIDVFSGTLKQIPRGLTNMAIAIGEYLDATKNASKANKPPNLKPEKQ